MKPGTLNTRIAILQGTVGALAVLALATGAGAQQSLILNDGTASIRTDGGFTIGTEFTVGPTSMLVEALGVWDGKNDGSGDGMDGLITSHGVGLWLVDTNSNVGTLIASNTVPSGASGALIGEFRYVFLGSPVILSNGLTYRLGAFYNSTSGEPFRAQNPVPFTPYVITTNWGVDGAHYVAGTSLADPTVWAVFTSDSYVGPNLLFIPVPEPTAILLLGAGSLWLLRRRAH